MATKSVKVVFNDGINTLEGQFTLNAILLSSIQVTSNPTKTTYRYPEQMDYTGLVVTALYDDESTADVTNACTIVPPAESVFDPNNYTGVTISYSEGQSEVSASIPLTAVRMNGLTIASTPTKTEYQVGESISYQGLVVLATYEDSGTVNVTNLCTFSPAEGKAFDPATDTQVTVNFYDEQYTTYFALAEAASVHLSKISVTNYPYTTAYKRGETISYSGIKVTATYSDDSTKDVSTLCSLTPAHRKAFDPDTDTTAEISYTDGGVTATTRIGLTYKYITGLEVFSKPRKIEYQAGESINYNGLSVVARYSDGDYDYITVSSITPENGKAFEPETDTTVYITYIEDGQEYNCTFALMPDVPNAIHITAVPYKTTYEDGEAINYSGLSVEALYSGGGFKDVTESCSITPASGKAFNAETDTNAVITYTDHGTVLSCGLSLNNAFMMLLVDKKPTRTVYNIGEEIDYSGTVIKAVLSDGGVHTVTDYCDFTPILEGQTINVTVTCAPPIDTYVFDMNSGYVANGAWIPENPTNTYIDIYRVKASHKYYIALGGTVGSRFRAMFTAADVSQATSSVTGTTIINANNPIAYDSVDFTPTSNGYIVIAKDNIGNSGIKTYVYDLNASASEKTATTSFDLTTVSVVSIALTKPIKTRYRNGDLYDYAGAALVATCSDGSILDVTDGAIFSPEEGTVVTSAAPNDTVTSSVTVSYGQFTETFDVTVGGFAIVSLEVTPPNKTVYHVGDEIDLTGCTVTAVYWNGDTKDVTSEAVFSLATGDTVSRYYTDRFDDWKEVTENNNNLPVYITYQEDDIRIIDNINVNDWAEHHPVYQVYDSGEHGNSYYYESYTSHTLYVSYYNVQTGEVEVKTFKGPDYHDNFTDSYQYVSSYYWITREKLEEYKEAWDADMEDDENVHYVYQEHVITTYDGCTEYGNYFGYTYSRFTEFSATMCAKGDYFLINSSTPYHSDTLEPIYSECYGLDYSDSNFEPLMPVTAGGFASYDLNLTVVTLLPFLKISPTLEVVTKSTSTGSGGWTVDTGGVILALPPCHYGETYDLSGYTINALYSDGTSKTLNLATLPVNDYYAPEYMSYSPNPETALTRCTTIKIRYNASNDEDASAEFMIGVYYLSYISVRQNPTKTSYRVGETINYSGITVIAGYYISNSGWGVLGHGYDEVVTSSVVFNPPNGTVVTSEMGTSINVEVSYTNQWNETKTTYFTLNFTA